jgi:flavin-dependent dehydrogenase
MPRIEPQVVLGAGLAGSAAGVLLARAGVPVLLLERTPYPQPRLCGEFISVEAVQALDALGVDVRALGGQATRGLRVACGKLCIETELPFEAMGLSRHTLDGALQQRAQEAGARLQRGWRAAIVQLGDGRRPFVLQAGDGSAIQTHTLLLACGKTDLAPLARPLRGAAEPLVGWQLHLRLAAAQARRLAGHVEVFLFDGGYGGLQPVDGGLANLCLLAPRSTARSGLPALLHQLQQECPLLAERLEAASGLDGVPQTIYRVPYGHLHRAGPADPPGLWRLGDQAAVIPSFTGDGMAIALHSASLAARGLLAGGDAAAYHRQLRRDVAAPLRRAQALYALGRNTWARGALLQQLQRWPALLGTIARLTRLPNDAALRA